MIQLDMKKRTRHIIIIIHCLYLSEMQLIDHPDSGRRFSDNDLDVSIALLRDIYKEVAERR